MALGSTQTPWSGTYGDAMSAVTARRAKPKGYTPQSWQDYQAAQPAVAAPEAPAPYVAPEPIKNPFLADAEFDKLGLKKQYDTSTGEVTRQKAQVEHDFYDPTDPTSRQNALIRAFLETRQKQGIAEAGAGQSNSGAAATAKDYLQREEGFGKTGLANEYNAAMGALTAQQTQLDTDYKITGDRIDRDAITKWASDPRNTPTPPAPAPEAAAPEAAPPPSPLEFLQNAVANGDWIVTTIPNVRSRDGRMGKIHVHSDGRRVWVPA